MKCKEQAGFLIHHPCTNPPELNCSVCGKDVCNDHARETDSGFACISCFKKQHVDQDLRAGSQRGRYYRDPYYYGYYHSYRPYGLHDRFDDRDRGAFEAQGADAGGEFETDADGS